MAHRGDQLDRIATLLDHGEYLPGLVLEPEDRTLAFDEYLAEIVRDFSETQWILVNTGDDFLVCSVSRHLGTIRPDHGRRRRLDPGRGPASTLLMARASGEW